MKNKKPLRYTGLWIDHKRAKSFEPFTTEMTIKTIESGMHKSARDVRSEQDVIGYFGSVNHEFKKNSREREQVKNYFRELSDYLLDFDHILVLGPGVFLKEFMHYISEDKHFKGKNMVFKISDKLTQPQFRKEVINHFTKDVAYRRVQV